MYWLFILSLAGLAAGFLVARKRPGAGWSLAGVSLAGALVSGLLFWSSQRPARVPELGNRSDDLVAEHLADAVVRRIPAGREVLLLQWRSRLAGRRAAALEGRLHAAGFHVVPMAPPAEVPSGAGDEKIRITMEEGGAPPQFLLEARRQHPECAAMIVLLGLSEPAPVELLRGLPPLFLDETAESGFPWRDPAAAGLFGAVVARRPARDWSAEKALAAGPEEVFRMRYELVEPGVAGP